ncbi:TIGR04283 family arsenosugar biosynthesis glycosyltransferase [Desulfomarina sp.]
METISIIIPTLNEEKHLPKTLAGLAAVKNLELIVVDGGSEDKTRETATDLGARVILSSQGRGHQLNRGIEVSGGELLLFLHGDSVLPHNFPDAVRKTMEKGYAAGAFSLHIDSPSRRLAMVAACANLRSRFFKMPYGDQGIFTCRQNIDRIGGFQEVPIMEDFIFMRSIRKLGKIHILKEAVSTSSRRWDNMGIIRTTCINQIIIAGYRCGVPLPVLARTYQRLKGVTQCH